MANSPAIKSCNPCLDRHSWSKSTETWFSMAGKKRDATLRWCDECCISNAVAAVAQPTLVGVLYWLGRSSQDNLYSWKPLPRLNMFYIIHVYTWYISVGFCSFMYSSFIANNAGRQPWVSCLSCCVINQQRLKAESPLANFMRQWWQWWQWQNTVILRVL